jgi:hypothetical protein
MGFSLPSTSNSVIRLLTYFFALDMERVIDTITSGCTQCSSLKKTQHLAVKQSTTTPPEAVGITFAADVMKRKKQLVLFVRGLFGTLCVKGTTSIVVYQYSKSYFVRG